MKPLLRYVKLGVIVAISAIYASPAFAEVQLPEALWRMQLAPAGTHLPENTGFVDADGTKTDLKAQQGKVVLVNFWATWCPPCIEEMPDLNKLAAEMKGKKFRIVALSQDRGGIDVARKYFTENGIDHLDVIADAKGDVARAMGVRGLPTSYLIKADGTVVGLLEGIAKWDSPDVIKYLDDLIAEAP